MKTELHGRKKPTMDVETQHSENKKWRYSCRLFGKNSLKERAMCYVDSFLDISHEISKNSTVITSQSSMFEWQQLKTGREELCFLCGPC
jgi:hypothetical protein